MEMVEGGTPCNSTVNKIIAVGGLITGIAASTGPIGFLIAGPSAIGLGVMSVICAFKE